MVTSLLNYINSNFNFEENEDTCLNELCDLGEYIVNHFVDELSFNGAVSLLNKSEILMNIFNFLVKIKSQDLKDLYHNSISISTLFMAYSEINKFNLDGFLYGEITSRDRKILTNEEVKALMIRIKAGDEAARNILVERNMGLIRKYAGTYARNYGMEFEDLMQQGSIGLLDAIEKFDYTLGYRFSTYATWWIRQEINRYCEDNCNTVRIPAHTRQLINKIRRTRQQIYRDTGIYPENSEVASILGITEEKVKELIELKIDSLVSLEQKIHDEEDGTELGAFVADDSYEPEEEALNGMTHAKLLKILDDVLTPKEKEIIMYRMGFHGRVYTLEEVGQQYGVTRERIRQIEAKALRKLSHPSVKKKLETTEKSHNVQTIQDITHFFPNYSFEQIRIMVPYLPENQKALVYKMFGKTLKDYYALGPSDIHNFKHLVIPSLNKLLKGESLYKEPVSIFAEFAGYSKEEILAAVSRLTDKQKTYLYSRYGEDLEGLNIVTPTEARYISGFIFPTIGKILRGEVPTTKKSIFDWFQEYRKEEVIEAINKLPASERTAVYQRFGETLEDFREGINPTTASFVRSTVRSHIGKLLRGEELGQKTLTIFDWYPDYSKEEVIAAINKLPTKMKSSVYERFGYGLDENHTLIDTSYLRTTVRNNIGKLLKGETIEVNSSMLSLVELFSGYPQGKLNKALRELGTQEIRLLKMKYGENYDEVLAVPNDINAMVNKVKTKLKKIMNSMKDERKNLYELVGLSKSILDLRIATLSDAEKEALYAYYGYDLENPAGEIYDEALSVRVENIIIPKLQRPTTEERTFVSRVRFIAGLLHNANKLLSFSEEEIVAGYLIYAYSLEGYYRYLINLMDIKEDLLKRMLKYMEKKQPFAPKMIGEMVSEYMLKYDEKNAVLS